MSRESEAIRELLARGLTPDQSRRKSHKFSVARYRNGCEARRLWEEEIGWLPIGCAEQLPAESAERTVMREIGRQEVRKQVFEGAVLTNRQKQVLTMKFGEGMTSGEIARNFRISGQRVSQILESAIKRLSMSGCWRVLKEWEEDI